MDRLAGDCKLLVRRDDEHSRTGFTGADVALAVAGDGIWGAKTAIYGKQYGTAGMGSVVAVLLRGSSGASTTLVAIDCLLDQGHYL